MRKSKKSQKQPPFDYLTAFPLPFNVMPPRLKELLTPANLNPDQYINIGSMLEHELHGAERECIKLMMAVVLDGNSISELPSETGEGVQSSSFWDATYPCGCKAEYTPSISGHDYIVASWSDGSSFTFNLAEKVWMSLGLTPRCEGNNHQRIIYDDLRTPVFNIADGEISSSYHWKLQKNINWKMRNDYLRRYLWMRGAKAVRIFYYEHLLEDTPELRVLMDGEAHKNFTQTNGETWYDIDLLEDKYMEKYYFVYMHPL